MPGNKVAIKNSGLGSLARRVFLGLLTVLRSKGWAPIVVLLGQWNRNLVDAQGEHLHRRETACLEHSEAP